MFRYYLTLFPYKYCRPDFRHFTKAENFSLRAPNTGRSNRQIWSLTHKDFGKYLISKKELKNFIKWRRSGTCGVLGYYYFIYWQQKLLIINSRFLFDRFKKGTSFYIYIYFLNGYLFLKGTYCCNSGTEFRIFYNS